MNFSPKELAAKSRSSSTTTTPTKPVGQEPYFAKAEVKLDSVEHPGIYLPYGLQYAKLFGVTVTNNLQRAMELRRSGTKAMSLREADIAARCKYPLDKMSIFKAMVLFETGLDENDERFDVDLLIEDLPGMPTKIAGMVPETIYEIRKFFNRGVKFRKERYDKVDEATRKKADQCMEVAMHRMTKAKLAPWPEEVENGFALELTKPEYMTFDQYESFNAKFSRYYREWSIS